jgi:hypothetical protein
LSLALFIFPCVFYSYITRNAHLSSASGAFGGLDTRGPSEPTGSGFNYSLINKSDARPYPFCLLNWALPGGVLCGPVIRLSLLVLPLKNSKVILANRYRGVNGISAEVEIMHVDYVTYIMDNPAQIGPD